LFVHVFDEYLQELTARVTEAAGSDAPVRERLKKTLNALFDFTRENERFMWLYWMLDSGEADGILPKELLDHVKAWTEDMFRATIEMVMAGQEEGIIRDIDPKLLVHMMSALNKGIIVHTNKERRFEIEDIDAESLQALSIELLNGGVFGDSRSTGKGSKSPKAKKP
jgi:AcrR family transcriptional regulator